MSLKGKILRCPTCRTVVTPQDEDFPFCSDRCRLIDLGNWSAEKYRISSPANPQMDEEDPDLN